MFQFKSPAYTDETVLETPLEATLIAPEDTIAPENMSPTEIETSRPCSFQIQQVQKQSFGFVPVDQAIYLALLNHSGMTLQPLTADAAPIFISCQAIKSVRLARSLNFATAVKLTLNHPVSGLPSQTLLFMASSAGASQPTQPESSKADNRSAKFVELANLLLQTQEHPLVQQLAESSQPIVAFFWAKGCQPCEEFAETVQQLEAQWGEQAQFTKVNMDDGPLLPMLYEVDSIPSVLIFKEQKVVDRIEGAIPEAIAHKILALHL